MASFDNLRERTVMCSESIEAFKVLSPDLLKELSVASKAQIQMFFKVMSKLITSAEESPGGKFYSLYLLLKASETSPTQDFLIELASSQELLHFIFWTASNDMGKGLDHSQRGKTYFLKNPTQNEANMGVNFVRLCLETGMFWGKYFGKKDPSDPRNTLWKRLENIAKRGELPSTFLFVGKDYPGRTEIASWNFAKGDLPSIPYKPTDLNDVRNKSASEIQEEKEKEKALINVKRVTYEEDLLKEKAESRPNIESRPNLDRILKSEPSDPSSPNAEEKFYPNSATKYLNEDLQKKSSQPGSKVNLDAGAQRSKPSSRVLEDSASRSKSPNILEDKPDLMKKVNKDLDSSLNSSYASKKDYQGYEGRSPNKNTFASRMAEMGVFNERTPTPERRKSPAPTQIQSNYQARTTTDKSSPQKRDGSPMAADLKSSTDNIRNFFNERDKPQPPKGVSARAWESSQTSPSKMFSPEITPQFIQTQSGRVSKSPELETKSRGFDSGPNRKDSGENAPIGRKGPVSRAGVPVQMNESSRVIPSNQNVDEPQSTEVKILAKQIESFRNENTFLMNEIQRYQEEFKRRMELEKLLIKENNHLKSTISNSSQQVQDMSLAMTDLYDKNQKLAKELLDAKKELEYYKGSRK